MSSKRRSSSSSRSSSARHRRRCEVADAGWGGHVKGRPLYTQTGELVTHRSIGAEQYGRFMIDVFEEWVRHDIGRVYVQMFDTALANWVGEPAGMCVHAETCGLQLALEHNGDLYCCDHFVEPDYLLGNIAETPMQQLITSSKQVKFGQDKRDTLTRYCLDCDVRFACNGGCPKDRFATSPYGESRPALPLPQLQELLPPRRPTHAHHGRPACHQPRTGRADDRVRQGGRPPGPQRAVHLRQRPQMEALPRSQLLNTAGSGRSARWMSARVGPTRSPASRWGRRACGRGSPGP